MAGKTSSTKQRDRTIRQAAARIREGGPPPRDRELARLALAHLRNRASYNARRKKVRDLAAKLRRGLRPRASQDLMDAAHRWLAYREQYNAERRSAREHMGGTRRKTRPASTIHGTVKVWRKTRPASPVRRTWRRKTERTRKTSAKVRLAAARRRDTHIRHEVVRLARRGVRVADIALTLQRSRFRIYQILESEGYTREVSERSKTRTGRTH